VLEQLVTRHTADVRRKIAVDQVRIAGDHAAEAVARQVREPFADAAQAEYADGQIAGATNRPRRQIAPTPGLHVAVVQCEVPQQREFHCQRMRRDFANAVVGRVGDPHAMSCARRGVDRVVAGAIAADDAELRQRGQHALGDRRVLHQECIATARRVD
jgi:hypothetical protein